MTAPSQRPARRALRLAGTGESVVLDRAVSRRLQSLLPGTVPPLVAQRSARALAVALGMKAKASLGSTRLETHFEVVPAVLDQELHMGKGIIGDAVTMLLASGVLLAEEGQYRFAAAALGPAPAAGLLEWGEIYRRFTEVGPGRQAALLLFAGLLEAVGDVNESWDISRRGLAAQLGYKNREDVDLGIKALQRSGVCRVQMSRSGATLSLMPAAVVPGAISVVAPPAGVPGSPVTAETVNPESGGVVNEAAPLIQNIFGQRFVIPPGAPPIEPPVGYTYVPRIGPDGGLEMALVSLSSPESAE